MDNERIVSFKKLCDHYNVEQDFLRSLLEYGLIEVRKDHEEEVIDHELLGDVEVMMHLYYDLEINMAGIDAISHLLKRVREMQQEMKVLRNKVDLFH